MEEKAANFFATTSIWKLLKGRKEIFFKIVIVVVGGTMYQFTT
jgi:hypothetical protein